MKNVNNNFNETIITKTLVKKPASIQETTSDAFGSLLNKNKQHQDKEEEIDTKNQEEVISSNNTIRSQVEIENISYLNKAFLFSVA